MEEFLTAQPMEM